jgi:hypothetical protein
MRNTVSNKRSHLAAKAKLIVLEQYGLDPQKNNDQHIKSVITWLLDGYRFMHKDPTVRPHSYTFYSC